MHKKLICSILLICFISTYEAVWRSTNVLFTLLLY